MGAIYEEFERELAVWRRAYAGRPREEVVKLLLLAIEREQIVTVAYREELMTWRLGGMAIADDAREIIRHALVWAWKDEEMHAIYCRGAVMRLGGRGLKLRSVLQQAGGYVGGWVTAVRQHVRWRDAPISRAVASAVAAVGLALGKIPREVRRHLCYAPFREFCAFNIDAERTAARCFERLGELLETDPRASPAQVDEVRRMQRDEERHAHVFATFAGALDEKDRLVAGVTADRLAERVAEAGEYFLPRARRRSALAATPLASGGEVHVRAGRGPEDRRPVLREVLDRAGLGAVLEERARAEGKAVADLRVAVKVGFMLGYSRRDLSSIADPELIDELVGWLGERGARDVVLVENRNLYDRFYANRSVREVAAYFGIESPRFRVVDASEEQVPQAYERGLAQYTVGRTWRDADVRISLGKMRSHPIEVVYLTVQNLEGLGGRTDEYLFAERQAHRDTAEVMLLDLYPPHFAVLDAYERAADGLLGMMACRRPRSPRRIYGGRDALSVDIVAARHLGLRDFRESPTLAAAAAWFGDPSEKISVVGVDAPVRPWKGPFHSDLSTVAAFFAQPVYEWASGRGALFVPEFDTAAFPPLEPEGRVLRAARRAVRALVGLKGPR